MNLEEELMKERQNYIRIQSLVRQLAGKNLPRGIPIVPDEREVQGHLDACRSYYELHSTKLGCDSPWIVAYNAPDHFSQIEHSGKNNGNS